MKIGKVASLGNRARIATEMGADAVFSATSNVAKNVAEGKEINVKDIAIGAAVDAVAGQTAGKKLSDRAKGRAETSPENAILNRQADRLERIANSPKASRPEAKARNAEAARSAQRDFITREGVKGGVVGSNFASTVTSGVIKMTTDE